MAGAVARLRACGLFLLLPSDGLHLLVVVPWLGRSCR